MARKAQVLTDKELKEQAEATEYYRKHPKGKGLPQLEEVVDSHGRKVRIRGG